MDSQHLLRPNTFSYCKSLMVFKDTYKHVEFINYSRAAQHPSIFFPQAKYSIEMQAIIIIMSCVQKQLGVVKRSLPLSLCIVLA